MAKTNSYIKLDRGLKNNALWLAEKPFTKGQAWVDLLILTQGVDKKREYRGRQQEMKHGHVYTSIYFLADRWGWSRMKVYRFLKKLMLDEMITVKGWSINAEKNETSKRTVQRTANRSEIDTVDETTISIVNWAVYQYDDTTDDTNTVPVRRTANRTAKRTHKRKNTENDTEKEKRNIGRCAPVSSRKMKPREEGTVEDIPVRYRKTYATYAEYFDARMQ